MVGSSPVSWEKAAAAAVKAASKSLRNLRIAEVTKLDMQLENGKALAYRARLTVSFKYEESGAKAPAQKSVAATPAPKAPRRKK